jgi:hypothetical protein
MNEAASLRVASVGQHLTGMHVEGGHHPNLGRDPTARHSLGRHRHHPAAAHHPLGRRVRTRPTLQLHGAVVAPVVVGELLGGADLAGEEAGFYTTRRDVNVATARRLRRGCAEPSPRSDP